ncbi:MAG: hypothetical protein ACSHX6_11195 [Akkermansiaceae bacterium]
MMQTRNINRKPKGPRKGFALIAVIWVVAFLSMILSVTIMLLQIDAESTISDEHEFNAWLQAHKGLSYASHPDIERGDEALIYEPEGLEEGYNVEIRSESSRINLNYVIRRGDKLLLKNLFNHWLNDDEKATELVDAMVDWVDKDDVVSLNGAENEWYEEQGFEGRPFNRNFQSLEEVSLVKGFNEVEAADPNWKEWFTLYSEGGIDIHEAEAEILSVVAETELDNAEKFVQDIKGEDGLLGTTDDVRHASVALALDSLESEQINRRLILNRFILQGATLRVESVGHSGDYRKKIQAVIRRQGDVPHVLYYQETILESE